MQGNPAMPERRQLYRDMALIFALALLPRLILALALPADDSVFIDWPYREYARNLAEGRGFWMPNPYSEEVGLDRVYAFRPPLFPFFWGCVYKVTAGAYGPIRVFFAFLSSLTCVLAYLAGRDLVRGRRVALLGGVACALYPPLIWHSVHLMTEPFFIFFSTTAFLGLFRFRATGRVRWLILAGIAAGLGALSRSILVAFLPVMAIWIWWVRGRGRRAVIETAAYTLIVTLVMTPWIVRNAIRLGAFVPATTDAGHGFYVANNEHSLSDPRGFWIPEDWSTVIPPGTGEVEASRTLMRNAARYLAGNPGTAARLMARRFATLWRFYPNPEFVGRSKAVVYALSYVPAFPFMLLGIWLAHRRARGRLANVLLVDMLVVYTTCMSVVFLAMMRYRVPLMPFLLVFAALGAASVWSRLTAALRR